MESVTNTRWAKQDGTPIEALLVEDNPGDIRLIEEAFDGIDSEIALQIATDGVEAIETLHRGVTSDQLPDLVLLDLNLPRMDGFSVLEAVRDNPDLSHLPILILTSSTTQEDILKSYNRSANAYLTKPVGPDEFVSLARAIEAFWVERAELPPASV